MQTETGLRELISKETTRQKQSYRRATTMIALVALVGLAWLAFSAINVVRLERRAKKLNYESVNLQQQIESEQRELESKKAELKFVSEDLTEKNRALNTARTKLSEGDNQGALKVLNAVKAPSPKPTPVGPIQPVKEIFSIRIDGSLSLEEIANALGLEAQNQHAELVSLSAATTKEGLINVATFKRLDFNFLVPKITLIALEGPERSPIQAPRDKILIRQTGIFVGGHLTKIAAFKERLGNN
ncbi:MAG: hypothetical protein QOK48_1807 [Blastocatellia bacterium]|jgi:Tfp pilus assembly protein PilX|nr:hypothetical protein [Blastocatellia bacterium]